MKALWLVALLLGACTTTSTIPNDAAVDAPTAHDAAVPTGTLIITIGSDP